MNLKIIERWATSPVWSWRTIRRDIMSRRSVVTIAGAVIFFAIIGSAQADETAKFRIIMHVTAAQTLDVSGVDGQTMTVVHYSGLASFADGSVGTANFTGTTDYNKG